MPESGLNRFPRNEWIKPSASIDEQGSILLGSNVYIGHDALVLNHTHDMRLGGDQYNGERPGYLEIGDHAYIGMRAIILPQVRRIGMGAIIGAGSVVTRDVPDMEVWAGNPARKVGERACG